MLQALPISSSCIQNSCNQGRICYLFTVIYIFYSNSQFVGRINYIDCDQISEPINYNMRKNSITDYYFCEECETYHHPNRKINGEYLAACECEVLGQSSQNSFTKAQEVPQDSSLFRLSASSQDFRHSKQMFQKSLLSQRSHHSGQNIRSLYYSPPFANNRNITGAIKQKIIAQNQQNNLAHPKTQFNHNSWITNEPSNNSYKKAEGRQKVQINKKPILGGKLSPPLSPRNVSPPMTPIIEEPSRESRIPWPATQVSNKIQGSEFSNIKNNTHKIPYATQIPIGSRLAVSNLLRSDNKFYEQYDSALKNTFLSGLSFEERRKIVIQNDEPECCGKLCYY